MPVYKNKTVENVDTFATNTDGKLSGKVGYLKPNEQFTGQDYGSVLKILSGEDAGRWVYESKCALVSSSPVTPPPPPPTTKTKTHTIEVYSDGSLVIDGVPYP